MKMWEQVSLWLVSIGALNWGLMLFDINLVTLIFQSWFPQIINFIYGAIGLAGAMSLWFIIKENFL